jgi:prevent-host-death family protein
MWQYVYPSEIAILPDILLTYRRIRAMMWSQLEPHYEDWVMREIGVRELKVKASEIMRNVRKRRTRYLITYRGHPVGVLSPIEGGESITPIAPAESGSSAWDELTRLGREIAQGWPAGKTSTDVLSEMRR